MPRLTQRVVDGLPPATTVRVVKYGEIPGFSLKVTASAEYGAASLAWRVERRSGRVGAPLRVTPEHVASNAGCAPRASLTS